MKERDHDDYADGFAKDCLKKRKPLRGQIELTYRCNLDCVHCYCKGREKTGEELSTKKWTDILDAVSGMGCLWLTITGGEPILRDDFADIYTHAKKKGFLITVFINGTILPPSILKLFKSEPPLSIEISLYAATEERYEAVTRVRGSFKKVKEGIDRLIRINAPVILKTVGLRENKDEILKVKALCEKLLGKKKFKFGSFIYPRLNGDKAPCRHRLSPREILKIESGDPDMARQIKEEYSRPAQFKRPPEYLYRCTAWRTGFFINPYGLLKFCNLSDSFSTDLMKADFKKGFYGEFPRLSDAKFRTDSACRDCNLRRFCYHCPARAYLETGNEESPVEYYCRLARIRQRQLDKIMV